MTSQDSFKMNLLEREKLALKRQRLAARNLENLRSDVVEKPRSEEIEEVDPVFLANTKKSKQVVPKSGQTTNFKAGTCTHFVDGKIVTPEQAFNDYNFSAYVASAAVMYHEAVGWDNVNLELFAAIMTNAFMVYGPRQNISLPAVSASMDYVVDNDMAPYEAMRKASSALRDKKPLKVYSDAVVMGKTAMIVDLVEPAIIVPQEPDLSVRATESLTNLMVATVSPPAEAMEEVIAELGQFDSNLISLDAQLDEIIEKGDIAIEETNPHRRLTKTVGLMSSDISVSGKHGLYQKALQCLEAYMEPERVPEVLIVPDYNLNATGEYTSAGSISRIIPLPKTPEHYSMLLLSIMTPYEEGLKCLLRTEIQMKEDEEFRKKAGSARGFVHALFGSNYQDMREKGLGSTPLNVSYATLFKADFEGTQELLKGSVSGRYDNHPVLVRIADFHQARKKSLQGECIMIDPPNMAGLYFSPVFIQNHFAEKTKTSTGELKHAKEFYVIRKVPTGAEKLYSSWIEKYIFAHMVGTLRGVDAREKVLTRFLAGYQSERQGSKLVQRYIKDLRYCYDDIIPTLTKLVLLVPGYSASKAFKHRTIICDWEAGDIEHQGYLERAEGEISVTSVVKENEPPPLKIAEVEIPVEESSDVDDDQYF